MESRTEALGRFRNAVLPDLVELFREFEQTKPIAEIWHRYQKDRKNPDQMKAQAARTRTARAMYEQYKKGHRIGMIQHKLYVPFWALTFSGAMEARDRSAAQEAVQAYAQRVGRENKWAKKMKEELQRLDEEKG